LIIRVLWLDSDIFQRLAVIIGFRYRIDAVEIGNNKENECDNASKEEYLGFSAAWFFPHEIECDYHQRDVDGVDYEDELYDKIHVLTLVTIESYQTSQDNKESCLLCKDCVKLDPYGSCRCNWPQSRSILTRLQSGRPTLGG
jgi:hypothetical protein